MKTLAVVLQLLAAAIVLLLRPTSAQVVVNIDVVNGNDTECLSAQEMLNSPSNGNSSTTVACQSIDRALGNVQCSRNCVAATPLANVTFRLSEGTYRLSECVAILEGQNIVFEAVTAGEATINCAAFPNEDVFDTLEVCAVAGITFRGIRFEKCGPLSANVFVNDSSDVVFEDCVFSNNIGVPLQTQFTSKITLRNTNFTDNINLLQAAPDINETSIEELYDTITTGGGFTFFSRDNPTVIIIERCNFINSSASADNANSTRPVLLKQTGHGGAILIRLAAVENPQISITDCNFENNFGAVDGGAVYLSLSEGVRSGNFTMQRNNFIGNRVVEASGGAVSINSFNFTYDNRISVEDCLFRQNHGNAGGAFSVALYDSNLVSTQLPDSVMFTSCDFTDNTANNEGTAVGLFSLVHVDQVGFPVSFENCTFLNNTSLEETEDTSAIAAFRFPIIFTGNNSFVRNTGGGITLLNTRMLARGSLLFEGNTAVFGAGIAMDDRCLLEIGPGVNITFYRNTATESGAGIYSEFPPIRFVVDIFNRLCFLQYDDGDGVDVPPHLWKDVVILFKENTARLSGAAIYASDMQQCGWLGSEFTTDSTIIFAPPVNLTKQFPNYPFQFIDNTLLPEGRNVSRPPSNNLATAPSVIHVNVEDKNRLVQPGETLQIDLLATDQVDNSREAVWSLEAPSQNANLDALSANNDTYPYRVPEATALPGLEQMMMMTGGGVMGGGGEGGEEMMMMDMPTIAGNFSSEFTLNFSLLRTLGSISTLNLTVEGCHPGFSLSPTTGLCVCNSDSNTDILRCDDNNRYLYLREGIWGDVTTNEGGERVLITARVQPGYIGCRPQGRLPGCLFEFDNVDAQCRDGRKGALCGTCDPGHGVTLDLQACVTTPCVAGQVVFALLYVAVVVVSILMLVFDVSLPNELKGFLFYAQVIGLVYRPFVVVRNTSAQIDGLGILLNLLGFSIPFPLCLAEGVRAHHIALLGYISPLLAIFIIAAYAVGARFIKVLSNHSALRAITFLSLFVYKYVADTAFLFISCLNTPFGFVFQYDGSLSCVTWDFGVFALIGLALVLFLVVPAPFVTGYICIKRPLRFQQYADILTKGLRSKHRWWGGWDIGRRLPFVFFAYFVVLARPSLVLFFMSLAALTVLIVHLFTKPYEQMYINVIEAAILLNLLMVTAAFLNPSNSPVPVWFSTLLVLLPYFYAIGYLGYVIVRKIWHRFRRPVSDGPEREGVAPGELAPPTADGSTGGTPPTRGRNEHAPSAADSQASVQPASSSQTSKRPASASSPPVEDFAMLREPLLEL